MYKIISLLCPVFTLVCTSMLYAQGGEYSLTHWKENGLPYIQNFSPKDYNAEIQNFTIAQDKRGLMYFGNNKGVLIYDGVSWRTVPTSNKTLARSLCLINNKIYVGTEGDFGYLSPDTTGELKFVSLLNLIPKKIVIFMMFTRSYQVKMQSTSGHGTIFSGCIIIR